MGGESETFGEAAGSGVDTDTDGVDTGAGAGAVVVRDAVPAPPPKLEELEDDGGTAAAVGGA